MSGLGVLPFNEQLEFLSVAMKYWGHPAFYSFAFDHFSKNVEAYPDDLLVTVSEAFGFR